MPTHTAPSEESAKTWATKPFVADEIRDAVAGADILLVPTEGYADRQDLLFFPAGTSELFRFLKDRVRDDVHVEVAATDDDYQEVARHADVMYLPEIIVNLILAPVLAGLLVEYIKMKAGRQEQSTTIKTSITLRDDATQRSLRVDYDGPATAFQETIASISKQLQSGAETPSPLPSHDTTGSPHPDQSPPAEVPRQTEQ
jgi:hypothetical protein